METCCWQRLSCRTKTRRTGLRASAQRRGACPARGPRAGPLEMESGISATQTGVSAVEDNKGAKGHGRRVERTETPSIVDDGDPNGTTGGGGCQGFKV